MRSQSVGVEPPIRTASIIQVDRCVYFRRSSVKRFKMSFDRWKHVSLAKPYINGRKHGNYGRNKTKTILFWVVYGT